MKLSNLAYGAIGYVLGARAGHERYDQIVGLARRVAGSQRVQATAGVVQAQLDLAAAHARQAVAAKLHANAGRPPVRQTVSVHHNGTNGHRRA